MGQAPDKLFQKVADEALRQSAWGFFSREEACVLYDHLTSLENRRIGFTSHDPAPIPGRSEENTGAVIPLSIQSEGGNIWAEKDFVHYTTRPTYRGYSLEQTRSYGNGLVKTIPRVEGWIDTVMESVTAQVIDEYRPTNIRGFLQLTNAK